MLKTSKKILSIIMVVIMVLTAVPLSSFVGVELPAFDLGIRASAISSSGSCGDNVTYTYNSSTGELVISGEGPMTDYNYSIGSPFYKSNIKSVVIGDDVTTIGQNAFRECYNLSSITIPDSVTTIGNYAFYNCYNLTNITIPDSVTTIGNSAFYNCSNLTSITIPDSVTTIGSNIFGGCSSLETLNIGSGIKEIPARYFANMTSLKTVNLSEGLEKIGNYAFSGCSNLTSFTIPDGVTTIGDYAFSGCTYLETINIPDSVTFIGIEILKNTAWFNYRGKGLIVLDGWAYGFKGTETGVKVNLPANVKGVADRTFTGDSNIVAFSVDEANPYFSSENGVLFNKDKTELLIYPCGKLSTDYMIPESVQFIAGYAFYENQLTNITFGNQVKTVGKNAFYNSFDKKHKEKNIYISSLENWCNIEFKDVYFSIENEGAVSHPLYNNRLYVDGVEATNIVIPESVTNINRAMFYGCTSIKSVHIPNSVSVIESGAFAECASLTNIIIGEHVRAIGEYAFYSCGKLNSITIPDGVTIIEPCTFYDCRQLSNVIIGNSVTTIGENAFYFCRNLEKVTFGKGIQTIGDSVFYGELNHKIKYVYYPGSQKDWEKVTVGNRNDSLTNADLYLMHSHEYTETVIKQVTCEEDGEVLYTCKLGDTRTEIIPALGHNWVDMGGSIEATCTTDGVDNYKCSNCGEEKKGTTPAFGHVWETIKEIPATCYKTGYISRVCMAPECGFKEEKELPENHYWMWDVNKEPTCTDEGENMKWCMECNMVSERKPIPALGHTYSAWVELLPATCSERGLNIKICNDCNDIQRQILPKLAHIDTDGNGICDTCENPATPTVPDEPDTPDVPDEPDTPDVPDTPNEPDAPEDPSANCSCNCHKSGLSKIIFNIILFFQRLFGSNKTCDCGASHY